MIVVFDPQCLLKHDRQGVFPFASIQGVSDQSLFALAGLGLESLQTLLPPPEFASRFLR